jgi:hypothetical protein
MLNFIWAARDHGARGIVNGFPETRECTLTGKQAVKKSYRIATRPETFALLQNNNGI